MRLAAIATSPVKIARRPVSQRSAIPWPLFDFPVSVPPSSIQSSPVIEHATPHQSDDYKFVTHVAPPLLDDVEWSFTEFRTAVREDLIAAVNISRDQGTLIAVSKEGTVGTVQIPNAFGATSVQVMDDMFEHHVTVRYNNGQKQSGLWWVSLIFPMMAMMLLVAIMRNVQNPTGGLFGSKVPGNFQEIPVTGVTFDDVAGCDHAKEELKEVVEFLKNPEKFARFDIRTPNCLLVGSPGVGKTLLARAVAGEANVPFFSVCGSDFVELFVGMGARKVRELFAEARKKGKCLIFVDEIDSLARKRGSAANITGGNTEAEQTLNQLLAEMDGFDSGSGIVVIGATNRPDTLDEAVLRSGRFDRKVLVEPPDYTGRIAIFKVHTKFKPLARNRIDFESIAKSTAGLTGADIENVCNEAAILALRKGKEHIEQDDFEGAIDKFQMGAEKKSSIISDRQRRSIAVHESGHTIAALLVGEFDKVKKVSIIARQNGAGGVTVFEPTMERVDFHLYTKEYLENQLVVALAGRIAEELAFGDKQITTGASSDLRKVADIARKMVVDFGFTMSLGTVAWKPSSPFAEDGIGSGYSEKTAHAIDEEIRRIVDLAYERSRKILVMNRDKLDALTEALIEKEVMSGDEVRVLLGNALNAPTFYQIKK